ncbi:MAG: HAD hydrolase-like protein [Syntrophorhabdaceae bacterium]|nr:HAD hydrolase-like protein [Syntrophorhabdaceae bacterium]
MIKLFVFDLGNVILPFDHRKIPEKLLLWSQKKEQFDSIEMFEYIFGADNGLINPYEEGEMSTEEFFKIISDRYYLNMSLEDFKNIWTPIFLEDKGVEKIILNLKELGYPLFILSNTNELHFTYIKETYPIVHVFNEWILSYEVGAKKPKKRIFEEIFRRAEVSGSEVFYVDDTESYVLKAKEMFGIYGVVYKGADELRTEIKKVLNRKKAKNHEIS